MNASVPLESILCTEELRQRAPRSPDYEKQSRALVTLARAQADSTPGILQTLAEAILDVTACDSSGITLLAEGGSHFYWPAIAGVWKSHIGFGTPRHCCPCGDVLDCDSPLLFRHFERRYPAFVPLLPSVEECLIVPFHLDGKAAGTLWAAMHTDRRKFDAEDERLLSALVPFASLAVRTLAKSGTPRGEPDFRLMIDSIPTLVYTIDPSGEVEFVNHQVVEYFGRTAEELKHWDKIGCVHPDDLAKVQASLRRSIEFGEPHEVQQRLRRADGVYRWFQSRARAERDSNGRLVRWFAALTDIEDLKQSEEAVRAEADLRQILNGIPGLVVTVTAEGSLESANEQVVSYTGRTVEQLKDWATLLHPEDRTETGNAWRRSLESGEPPDIEARIVGADGVYRWFQQRGIPRLDANGKRICWYVLLTEIDQHKKIAERLRESEAFLLDAQRLSHTGSWKHDLASNAVSVTPEIARIYAIEPHEDATTADFFFNRVHPEDVPGVAASYECSIAEKRDFASDFRIVLGDGSIRYIRNTGHPKFNEAGALVEVLGTAIDVTEQTLAKAELRAIISAIPSLAWSAGADGSCDFLNQRWLDYTGLSAEQALGFGWSVVIHPDDAKGLLAYWQVALSAGSHVDVEARMRRFDGAYRWFLFRADPLRNESGQIVKWYGTNFDIEDRKRAEDEVRENEQNLRAIINTIPTLSWSTRPDGYVEFLSQRWLDFTGLSAEEAEGFGWAVAIHPEDAPGLVAYWQAALASGAHVDVEARLRRFDGVYRWLLFRADPLRDASGQIVKWYGTNFDIEDRKRVEEALRASERSLRESEQSLRLLIDTLPALISVTGPRAELELINQQMSHYLGKSLEDMQAWQNDRFTFDDQQTAMHPDDLEAVTAAFGDSLRTGEPFQYETRLRRSDGVYRWFQVRGLPLRGPQGNIVRWHNLHIDVEDRKRAEEALRASEHNLRLIIDSIPALVCTMGARGEVEDVNRQLTDYFGKPLDQLRDWSKGGIHHPEDLDREVAGWRRSVETGQPHASESRIRRADGVYRWFRVTGMPLRNAEGRIVRWYMLLVDCEDRHRAEEALRASELNLRLIFDTIPALVCTMSAHGELELINRQIHDYFGLTLDSLKDWSLIGAVHPDDLEAVVASWRHSIETGDSYNIEHRIRRADGIYRWFHVSALPLRDAGGGIVRWYVLLVDSEDRRRAEESLRNSERNLRQLTETIPEMLWSATPEGAIDYCNTRVFTYTGRSDDAVLGEGWLKALHPDDAALAEPIWLASVATGTPYQVELRALHADGTYRWCAVSALPLLDEQGRIQKWHGTIVDVHNAKLAQEKLRRSEAYLAEAQRLSHTGSFGVDHSGDEHFWSEETSRIFGYDPAIRITTQLALDRFHPEDLPLAKKAMVLLLEGKEAQTEARLVMPDGRLKYVRFIGHGTKGRDDGVDYIGAVQDVTEQRSAEDALAKLNSELAHLTRVSSLGALTASIAHEINQPLSGIVTNAGICVRMLSAFPPNVEGALDTARRTIRDGNRASDVITRLRGLFSKKAAPAGPVDLNEATQEVMALSLSELQRSGVVVQPDLTAGLPSVKGDRVQLQQVILNLVRNAADAMVDVEDRPRQLVIRTEREEGGSVRLSVRDQGAGFDPQSANRLFEAFYTTKENGMGIGLSVSRAIIESHHGRLWAEPNDGPGSTVAFSIPVEPPAQL